MADPGTSARIFAVLSAEVRVRIIDLLKRRPLCVSALAGILKITPAAVSQHLRILRQAGIVTPVKRGYFVHYGVNGATLPKWRKETEGLLTVPPGADGEGEGGP